jgi:hypothetical protein
LEHAVSLIDAEASEFKIADAIMNLKRAINVRLKLLDELYQFSYVGALKKMGALERLEAVGLAKPFLIKQLFELRNDIEHNDASPPPLSRVKELLDITWYFLRSTDSAASNYSRTLIFESPDNVDDQSDLWLEVEPFSAESNEIKIRGWLAPPIFSYQEGWEISVERIEKPPVNDSYRGAKYFESHGGRHPDQRLIVGAINAQSASLFPLWRRMFSIA